MRILFFLIFLSSFLWACGHSKPTLPTGSRYLQVRVELRDTLLVKIPYKCVATRPVSFTLTEVGSYAKLSLAAATAGPKGVEQNSSDCTTELAEMPLVGASTLLEPGDFFIGGYEGYKALAYTDRRHVLQGLSVALKIRSEVKGDDSLPGTAETGFNPAVAYGYQYRRMRYSTYKNAFGNNTSSIGLTGGVFLGASAVALKSSTTRGEDIAIDRNAPAASLGLFGLVGFDKINVGLAVGIDHAFRDRSEDWLYQNKPWVGFLIGLDLIK